MTANVQRILREIRELTPEERAELRQNMETMAESPEQAFDRRLQETGLVTAPRLPRDPNRPPNPTPIVVEGEPLSQTLIRERR